MSVTLGRKWAVWSGYSGKNPFDCPLYYSAGLAPSEFILSLRSSPSDRHVNFYKVRYDSLS